MQGKTGMPLQPLADSRVLRDCTNGSQAPVRRSWSSGRPIAAMQPDIDQTGVQPKAENLSCLPTNSAVCKSDSNWMKEDQRVGADKPTNKQDASAAHTASTLAEAAAEQLYLRQPKEISRTGNEQQQAAVYDETGHTQPFVVVTDRQEMQSRRSDEDSNQPAQTESSPLLASSSAVRAGLLSAAQSDDQTGLLSIVQIEPQHAIASASQACGNESALHRADSPVIRTHSATVTTTRPMTPSSHGL